MKNAIFLFIAALVFTAAANAQSTVDSIEAKYKLQPMPEALTTEKTFPVLGNYQLSSTNGTAQTVTVTSDTTNKGVIWISGLPEGTMKAYLKTAPGTYRIVSQKSQSGTKVPEGTLIFDPSTNLLNIALGKAFDAANPSSVFANMSDGTALTDHTSMNETVGANTVKVKTKTPASKTKTKLIYYTATKVESSNSTSTNAAKQ